MVKNICRLYLWVFFLGTMLAFSSCQNEQQKNLLSEDAINGSVSDIYSNAVAPLYNYIGKDSLETSDADPLYHIWDNIYQGISLANHSLDFIDGTGEKMGDYEVGQDEKGIYVGMNIAQP